jgi:copper chaperone CopZ
MYADHHVVEVRQILFELQGVEEVYASSAFQAVEITYDPNLITIDQIEKCLDDAGYLGEFAMPSEAGVAAYQSEGTQAYFRHTAVYETSQKEVSFAQNVTYSGRPLWHCPGMGIIRKEMEE